MAKRAILLIAVLATLAGCARIAESRLNPFNWFGRDRAIEAATVAQVQEDPRPLVSQVISVSVERAPGGAVLRAVGLPPRQGYWQPALIGGERDGAVLTYQLRAEPPPGATRTSTQQSRELVVATFVSDQTLAGIREIRVLGAQSSRAVRR